MIRAYRLVHVEGPEHERPFGGTAATNRWNGGGTEVAYAAESIAVCALEILAQWRDYASLRGYGMYGLDLDPGDVEDVSDTDPALDPDDRDATRAFGDAWAAERRSLALRIPSVVVPFGCNFLVNPHHPRFDPGAVLDLGGFRYDDRIVALVTAAKGDDEGDEPPAA